MSQYFELHRGQRYPLVVTTLWLLFLDVDLWMQESVERDSREKREGKANHMQMEEFVGTEIDFFGNPILINSATLFSVTVVGGGSRKPSISSRRFSSEVGM